MLPNQRRPFILLLPLLNLHREKLLQKFHRLEIQIRPISPQDRLRITHRTFLHPFILQVNDTSNTEYRTTTSEIHGSPRHTVADGTDPIVELRDDGEDFAANFGVQVAGDGVGEGSCCGAGVFVG